MSRSSLTKMLVTVCFCVLCGQTCRLLGQTFTADIVGTVQDTTGAIVPATKLTLTQVNTGVTFTAATDDAGNYVFSQLQPSHYRLEASKEGFKTKTVADIELLVGQRARIDVILELGAVTQTVEVSAGGTQLLETQTSEVGQVINERAILELPLNGRNFIQLASLAPGVFPSTSNNGYSCVQMFTGGGGPGGASIAPMGLRESNVSYLIDGIETRGARWGNATIKPSPDATQEFKMETSNFAADSGRSSVITNITLKAGSNSFHGSAYEFLRNSSLDANDFFRNEAGLGVPPFQQNNFGAFVGGPIRRDKLFFFGGDEGLRSRRGLAINANYPSAAQLAGNLADDSAGTGIFPTSSPFCQANAGSPKCIDVINPFTGQPFSGNVIPPAMLDATSQKFVPYFRQPNVAVAPNQFGLPAFNFAFAPKEIISDNQFHVRMDYNISEKDRLFGSYSYDDRPHLAPALAIDTDTTCPWRGQVVATSWTHTFSPTTVNEFRFGYNSSRNASLPQTANGPNIEQTIFGLQNPNPTPETFAVPFLCVPGPVGPVGFLGIALDTTDRTYHFSDTLAVVKGRHSLKMGGTYHHEKYFYLCPCLVAAFCYSNIFTGAGLGDFLLGIPSGEAASFGAAILESRADYFGVYFQDDFRIRPDLTLNLGIRYETQEWPRDIAGREETFIPTTGTVAAVFRGEIRNGLAKTPHKDFGPRVGFAYSPSFLKNTTIRSSFGIFYATDNWNEFGSFAAFGPDFIVDRAPSSDPTVPTLFMKDAFPAVTLGVGALPPGTGIFATDPSNTTPYVQQWNFDVQHTFGSNWLLDVAYAGSVGQHLFQRRDENLAALDPTGTIRISRRRPYKQFDFILTSYTGAWSSFNALLAKVEHRVTANGYLLAAYTWDKALDLGNCCNYGGINRDFKVHQRGPSDATAPQRLSVSYVYDLPVGLGKPLLSGASGLADKLIGGWSVNGITTFSMGLFTTPQLGFNWANLGAFNSVVPNKVGPVVPANQTLNQYWIASGYALPGCPPPVVRGGCPTGIHIDGNAQRNSLEEPGINNWDIGLEKTTKFREHLTMQFRGEFFNAFNHPQFGAPNRDLISGQFGLISGLGQSPREIQFGVKLLW